MKPDVVPEPSRTRSPVGLKESVVSSCPHCCAGCVICSWAVLNLRDQVWGLMVVFTGSDCL